MFRTWGCTAMLITAVLAFCTSAFGCTFGEGQVYRPGAGYHFKTHSYVLERPPKRVAVTCISNMTNDWISVHWFIPKASSWVPPRGVFPKERYLRTRDQADVEGCLEYGNLGETVVARFVGDELDAEASVLERAAGCAKARNNYHSVASKDTVVSEMSPIKVNLKYFFPYDPKFPAETMMKLEGVVVVEPLSKTDFSVKFNFGVDPYNSNGKDYSKNFVANPIFPMDSPMYKEYYIKYTNGETQLAKLGATEFILTATSSDVKIEEAFLDVSSSIGGSVTRIGFPVFVGR